MRPTRLLLALASLFVLGGCAGVYTDIRQVDEKTYVLTRTKQGFLHTYGTVFRCTVVGDSADLKCLELDSP